MASRYLLAVLAALAAVAAEPVETALRLASGDGAYIAAERAALWSEVLGRPDVIYREAEAGEVTLAPNQAPVDDPAAGGGVWLAHVTGADYRLPIPAAGAWHGWARVFLPRPGSWTHEESMDGGAVQKIRDSERWYFGSWFWTPLGTYDLKPGEHAFHLDFRGGARLDAILFTADAEFNPELLTGVPQAEATRGTITTAPIRPSAVARWDRLTIEADSRGGAISAEASTDGGTTWLPADDGLANLSAHGDGGDTLLVRLTLTAAPDGASPQVSRVAVNYDLADDAEVELANEAYRIAFARRTGQLAGIRNRVSGVDLTPAHLQQPLFALAVREPGANEQTLLAGDEFTLAGIETGGEGPVLRYSGHDLDLTLRVTGGTSGAMSQWRLNVANRSAREVIRIDFPLVRDAALGQDFRDDEIVLPRTGGWRITSPATDKTWMTTYLGGGSMSWMDLWDPSGGLYLAMLDPTLRSTAMECAPATSRQAVDLAFRTHTLVKPGASKERVYAVGVHTGDWHWAADRYREWANGWLATPESPEWVEWTDGWIGMMGEPFASIGPRVEEARATFGIPYLQYWAQMADGIDQCCGNFPWPAPALGGAEGFRDGIAAAHEHDGYVTGYFNCQTWTRDSPLNEMLRKTPKSALPPEARELIHGLDWFEQNRLAPLDGKPVGYYADTLGWYIMCPAASGFTQHLNFWMTDMYGGRFRADGAYIDQAGATLAKPCYNLNHGHDDIGDWGLANVELIRRVKAEGRRLNPNYIVAIEGAGDALGQYADLHLISGLCTHPEVYHYTFPEQILISGLSNSSPLSYHQRITRAFLNGDRFDGRFDSPGLETAVRLRQRVKRWLYPARFQDTVGLAVSHDDVLARWNLLEEEGAKAIVINFDNESRRDDAIATLVLPAGWTPPGQLYVFDREGGVRVEAPNLTDGRLTVAVPTSSISSALLLAEVTAADSIDVWQQVGEAEVAAEITLNLVNYGDQATSVELTLTPQAPLTGAPETRQVTVPPMGTEGLTRPAEGVERLDRPSHVRIEATWDGGARTTYATVRPLLLNPSLTLDTNADSRPDHWHAGGTTNMFEHGLDDGGVFIQGQPDEFQYLRQQVPLKPNTRYRFAGWLKRTAATKQISMAVVEHIGERGLRVHTIGDQQTALNTWERFETTFTSQAEFRAVNVYLYNTHNDARGWYKGIELEEVE